MTGYALMLLAVARLASAQTSATDGYILTLVEAVPERLRPVSATAPAPLVYIRTTRQYPCLKPLAIRTHVSRARIRIRIDGMASGKPCRMMPGPAGGSAELNVPSGSYALEIGAHGRTDRYRLLVTDSSLTVDPAAGQFTSFDVPSYRRAQRNTLSLKCTLPWKDGAPVLAQQFVCDDVAAILADSLGAVEFSPGSGPGWAFWGNAPEQPRVRYFRYSRRADFIRAYDLVQAYSRHTMARVAPYAHVELSNWRAETIRSYLCRPDQAQWCTDALQRPRP